MIADTAEVFLVDLTWALQSLRLILLWLTAAWVVAGYCYRGGRAAKRERGQGVDQVMEGEQPGEQVAAGKGGSKVLSMCFSRQQKLPSSQCAF